MTPSAAIPTTSPRLMKPRSRRKTILRVASLSRITSAVTCVCRPFFAKSLQRLSRSCGVDSATEVEIVCLGRRRTAGQSFEHILGGYDVPSKGGRPSQDPDHAQVPRLAGLGVFYPEVEVFGQILVVGVEASELHGRLH